VKTVHDKLSTIPGMTSSEINLKTNTAKIMAEKKINLSDVALALSTSPKYQASELTASNPTVEKKESVLKTYKPLITLFVFIILVSAFFQISVGKFELYKFMNHLMAGFFIGLSFFKFLDLNAFSESFSSYDPLVQKWPGYGKIYPLIELTLGLLFVSGKFLLFANIFTILILSLTTYGVYLRLQSKSKFQCACLGTTFNIPLSNVTIVENLAMIVMALYNLRMT
jgi:uncharacterized membrane protein YphA (DoxX/SURF4 family)